MSRKEGEFTLLLDDRFDILWYSESLCRMLGWGDVTGRNGTEFVHADDLALVLEAITRARSGDEHKGMDPAFAPEAAEIRVADVNGAWHSFQATTWNHLDDGEVRGVLCTCRRVHDRSDLARAIEALGSGADVHKVLPIVARLADHSMGGAEARTAIAWKQGDTITIVSAVGTEPLDSGLAGVAKAVWDEGLRAPLVITDFDDPILKDARTSALAAGYRGVFIVPIEAPAGPEILGALVVWSGSTIDFHMATQTPLHVALCLAALAISDHRTKRTLRWAASHDPLTGLANRAEFARRLDQAASGDLILLYIDLDDFKPINDVHGHPVGDFVLTEVGHRIASVIGPHDTVGRLGGDEFAVVCAGMNDPAQGRALANRIIEAIRVPLIFNGVKLAVGASVGVAVGAQPLIPAMLALRADEALYEAKNAGKNTVRLAS
jgi:diguanylate cyclase (GGDEF)-like protein/PAS domain S-box-containing protein